MIILPVPAASQHGTTRQYTIRRLHKQANDPEKPAEPSPPSPTRTPPKTRPTAPPPAECVRRSAGESYGGLMSVKRFAKTSEVAVSHRRILRHADLLRPCEVV
jgi:hypothetical protein